MRPGLFDFRAGAGLKRGVRFLCHSGSLWSATSTEAPSVCRQFQGSVPSAETGPGEVVTVGRVALRVGGHPRDTPGCIPSPGSVGPAGGSRAPRPQERAAQQQTLGAGPVKPRGFRRPGARLPVQLGPPAHSVLRRHDLPQPGPSSQARFTWCGVSAALGGGGQGAKNSPGRGGVGVTLPGNGGRSHSRQSVHSAHWMSIGQQATYLPSSAHGLPITRPSTGPPGQQTHAPC